MERSPVYRYGVLGLAIVLTTAYAGMVSTSAEAVGPAAIVLIGLGTGFMIKAFQLAFFPRKKQD